MTKVKVIIFDFDETIYQGKEVFGDKWTSACVDLINHFFKNLNQDQKKSLYAKYEVPYQFDRNLLKEKPAKYCLKILLGEGYTIQHWIDYWENHLFSEDWSLVTNVISNQMLSSLAKEYKLYIVSASLEQQIKHHAEKLNIDLSMFSGIFSNFRARLEKGTKKDYYYQLIMEKENALPEECLVIGDSYESDLVPAVNLKMHVLHVNQINWDYEIITQKIKEIQN